MQPSLQGRGLWGKGPAPLLRQCLWSWCLCWDWAGLPGHWDSRKSCCMSASLASVTSAWLLQVSAWSPLGHLLLEAFLGHLTP